MLTTVSAWPVLPVAFITISPTAFLCVVLGISLFGYLQSRFFFGIVLFVYFRVAVDFFQKMGISDILDLEMKNI